MKNTSWAVILKKSMLCFVGLVINAFGAVFLLRAGFGMDAFGVWAGGVSNTFHITFGDAILVTSLTLLTLALIFARHNVGIGTVFFVALAGSSINVVESLLWGVLPKGAVFPLPLQALLFSFGILFVCMGLSMIVACRFGYNTGDALLFKISDKTHIQYRWLRITNDCLYVFFGFLLGGSVGIGTLTGAFLYGPLIVEIVKVYNKTILKWTGLQDERNEFKKKQPETDQKVLAD